MKKHLTIRIDGLVQGVFFRASTKRKADELNIKGFVRNESDGSVYVEAEGSEEDLSRFLEWCRKGPPTAKVEKLEVSELAVKGFSTFAVNR